MSAHPLSTRRPGLRGPLWVLGVGGVLVVLAAGMWVVGWWRYGDIPEHTGREAADFRDRFVAEVAVPGEVEVELDEGRYLVYVVVPAGAAAGSEVADPTLAAASVDVTLTGSDGAVVEPAAPDPDGAPTDVFQGAGTPFELALVDELVVSDGGDHVLAAVGTPPDGVTTIGIAEAVDPHAGADAVLLGGALFLLGLLVGGLGAVVGLIGGIWTIAVVATRPSAR